MIISLEKLKARRMPKMVKGCRDFIDSLYPKRREWKDNEIVDVIVYYSSDGCSVKYTNLDMVLVFDRTGECVKTFSCYDSFVDHIGGK
jgi:hypothetical protein